MTNRMDMRQQIIAYAKNTLHCDDNEAITFARELLRVRAGLFEVKFPELKAQQFMSRNNEMSPVDEEFTYQTVDEYGTTKLGSSYSTDAPRADVSFREAAPQRVRPITSAYGYTFHEAAVSAQLGRQLPQRRAAAARKTIAQEVDRILSLGDTSLYGITLQGLLTLPLEASPGDSGEGIRDYQAPNGDLGQPQWLDVDDVTPLKTPDEILRDMNGMANFVVKASNDVEHPTRMILPLSYYQHIATTRLGLGSDTTILRHFLATSQYVRRVDAWFRCDAAPNAEWTGRQIMCYDDSADVLEYLLPVEFRQQAPQLHRNQTIIDCDARIGGVVVYRPKAICRAVGM